MYFLLQIKKYQDKIYNFRTQRFLKENEILSLMVDISRCERLMKKSGCFFETCYYTLMGYPVDYFPDDQIQTQRAHDLDGWIKFYVIGPILKEIELKSVDFFNWVYIFIAESESEQNLRKVFSVDLYESYFNDDKATSFTDILHVISFFSFLKDEQSERITERLDLLRDCLLHILRLFMCFPDYFMCINVHFDVEEYLKVYSLIRSDVTKITEMYISTDIKFTSLQNLLKNSVLVINLSECVNKILVQTLTKIGTHEQFIQFQSLYTEHIKSLRDEKRKYLSFNSKIGPAQVLADGFCAKINIQLHENNVFSLFPKDMQLCNKEIFILQEVNTYIAVRPDGAVPRLHRKCEGSKPNLSQAPILYTKREDSKQTYVQTYKESRILWENSKKDKKKEKEK